VPPGVAGPTGFGEDLFERGREAGDQLAARRGERGVQLFDVFRARQDDRASRADLGLRQRPVGQEAIVRVMSGGGVVPLVPVGARDVQPSAVLPVDDAVSELRLRLGHFGSWGTLSARM
jgi:hypothetical protein